MNSIRFGKMENESVGTLLLSIWLIVSAVLLLTKISFANQGMIMAGLAVVAGVLLVLQQSSNVDRANSAANRVGNIFNRGRGVTANLGILVLSIWLIVSAVLLLAKISFANEAMIMASFAIVAGVLLLLRQGGRFASIGWLLLSVWLVVQGAMVLFSLSFSQSGIIMAALALAAGVLILLRR